MKYKLSRKFSIIIGLLAIFLYVIGIILSNIDGLKYRNIGIICEIIALLYTSITNLSSAVIPSSNTPYVTPTFVDRVEAIRFCVSEIYNAIFEKKNGDVIAIKYLSTGSIGKTELLKKIMQVLKSKSSAKEYLSIEQYKKYCKVRKKIGDIYFETYKEESDLSRVNDYPQTLHRYDIVIWDNLPSTDIIPVFRKNLIIILCRKANADIGENAVLTCISKSDMVKLSKAKGQQSIDDALLEKIMKYSKGDMKIITEILGSTYNIDIFKKFSNSVYTIKAAIDHGNYDEAKILLESAKHEIYRTFTDANTLQLEILEADLLHYKNHYKEANEAFISIAAKNIDNETLMEVYERQCHIYRHLGEFKMALTICEYLPRTIRMQRALGLNFMAYSQYEDERYYEQAIQILNIIRTNLSKYTSGERDSYHTYKAVEEVYEHNYISAHNSIDIAIELYESFNSKLLTNCYFIKAEIYRHSGRHSKACKYYQKCLSIYEFNGDFDIYTLVHTLITYETIVHNARCQCKLSINSDDLIKRAQDLDMKYNYKLATMLQKYCCSTISKSDKIKIANYFEKYVFIIP